MVALRCGELVPITSEQHGRGGGREQHGIARLLEHRRQRTDRLGVQVSERGISVDDVSPLIADPRGFMVVQNAVDAVTATSNDLHIAALASAIAAAVGDDGDLDIAEVLVDTLVRMTDADAVALWRISESFGTQAFSGDVAGVPEPIVARLIGLGLVSFDGLYRRISPLGWLVLHPPSS